MHEPTPSAGPATGIAALFAARLLLILLAAILAGQLMGCGGGGDDGAEPDKTIDPLICMHRPELCK